jgi:hypothetical protein
MPAHHDVRSGDVIARRLHGNLAAAADRGPKDFTDLLLTPGVSAERNSIPKKGERETIGHGGIDEVRHGDLS